MNKKHIILISIIAVIVLVAGGIYLFQSKSTNQSNNQGMPGDQDITESSIDSLSLGNWASIVAEKGDDGVYIADMVSVCESEDSCSNQQGGSGQTPPSGEAPTGRTVPSGDKTAPTGATPNGEGQKDMSNKSMLSGTIIEIGENSITLELDTGETATVTISDSTRIVEK